MPTTTQVEIHNCLGRCRNRMDTIADHLGTVEKYATHHESMIVHIGYINNVIGELQYQLDHMKRLAEKSLEEKQKGES